MIARLIFRAALIFAATTPTVHAAETYSVTPELTPGYVQHATLDVIDSVEGGCWTNVDLVTAKINLLMEQNDVPVLKSAAWSGPTAPKVVLYAFGHRTGGVCAVHVEMEVFAAWHMNVNEQGYGPNWRFGAWGQIYKNSLIMTSGTNVNGSILEFSETSASEFLSKVLAGRRTTEVQQFFEAFPDAKDPPPERENLIE